MPATSCRCRRAPFHPQPLLRLENMSKAAQYLPDAAMLDEERGVEMDLFECSGCSSSIEPGSGVYTGPCGPSELTSRRVTANPRRRDTEVRATA